MKVLVTGSTGFIGGNIVKKLLEDGFKVNVLIRKGSNTKNIENLPVEIFYGDICNPDSLNQPFEGCDGLFHAAALYSFWAAEPKIFYDINVEGTKNIIKAALNNRVSKIIYTSSESTLCSKENGIAGRDMESHDIFRDSKTIKNNYFPEINELNSVSGDYKKSKVLAEMEVLKMIRDKVPVIIINPTTPIGPGDVKPTPTGKIIVDFLNKKMPAYVNTGLNIVDVEDVAEAHLLAFKRGGNGKRYIIGNENLTLKQIFEILENITGIKAPSTEIPLWLAKTLAYADEFLSGKIMKKHPKIPLSAVKTAYKYRFFNCRFYSEELGLKITPAESSFRKAVQWFKDNGYVRKSK